jgi:hypothetical protein
MATKRNKKTIMKPETPDAGAFKRLADFVRRIVAVPKREADARDHLRHNRKHA